MDAEAAQRAGMRFVAVATGFSDAAVWRRFPTLALIEDTRALPELLAKLS